MTECEDCKRRREALVAAAKKMAEWIKHPIGRPPLDIKQTPDQTKTELPG